MLGTKEKQSVDCYGNRLDPEDRVLINFNGSTGIIKNIYKLPTTWLLGIDLQKEVLNKEGDLVFYLGTDVVLTEKASDRSFSDHFWALLNGYKTKADFKKYPGKIFFVVGKEVVMEYRLEDSVLWVNPYIWDSIGKHLDVDSDRISDLISSEVKTHSKLENVKPLRDAPMMGGEKMKQHFGLK